MTTTTRSRERDRIFLKLFLRPATDDLTNEDAAYFREHPDQIDEVTAPVNVHGLFLWAGALLRMTCFGLAKTLDSSQLPFALLLLLSLGSIGHPARGAETPPVLAASELLSPEQLQGPHHHVTEEVPNDGYMNTYRIVSDYGEFEAYGGTMLTLRLQEVDVLSELSRLSKTEVFLDALARTGMSDIQALKEFAKRPVKTIKGVPDGAKRWLERTERTLEEDVAAVKAGAKAVKREVAEAKAKAKSKKLEEPPKGDGASESGSKRKLTDEEAKALAKKGAEAGTKYVDKYFGLGPAQREWARALGVDPYTSNQVMQKALYQVAEVAAAGSFTARKTIPQIAGIEGRGLMIERAATAESEEEAVFFTDGAKMLAWFHESVSPIERFVGELWLPGAVSVDGRLVYLLPIDHISFTEEMAGAGSHLAAIVVQERAEQRELWLRGTASERYGREAAVRGWIVREKVTDQ